MRKIEQWMLDTIKSQRLANALALKGDGLQQKVESMQSLMLSGMLVFTPKKASTIAGIKK